MDLLTDCAVCSKPLADSTVVTDHKGLRYHITCWCRLMDVRIQETRDALRRQKEEWDARHAKPAKRAEPPPDS